MEAKVRVTIFDDSQSPACGEGCDLASAAQGLPLPLVAINGVFRLSGNIDYRQIVEAIETAQEVNHGRGL